MTPPSFIAAGAASTGTAPVGPLCPAHVAGDILLLIDESLNQTLATPNGWLQVSNSPQSDGAAGVAGATRLAAFWRRATSDNEAAPFVADPGDHILARILAIRGCPVDGDPIAVTAGNDTDGVASVDVSVPGAVTPVDECLILAIASHGTDTAAAEFSAWANADLAGFAEVAESGTVSGLGGGFAVAAGTKAVAGAFGPSTALLATASLQARLVIAFKPATTPSYRNRVPKLVWGDAYENTLSIGYPLDEAVAFPKPRDGSEETQGSSGVEDAWDEGTDHYLKSRVRWIPKDGGITPEGKTASGWDGSTGWREFLTWAWRKNVVRFYADSAVGSYKECYVVLPREEEPGLESNFTRALTLMLRTADGTPIEGY